MSPRAHKTPAEATPKKKEVARSPVPKPSAAPAKPVSVPVRSETSNVKASNVKTSNGEASNVKTPNVKGSIAKASNVNVASTAPSNAPTPNTVAPVATPAPVPELRQDGSIRPPASAKQLEDKALVQRARTGDQMAYNELVKRHKHGVERLIRPMVRTASSDEVEDLVQEALTKAMLHLNSYSDDYAFSTWLYRIATNHAIDYLRRKKLNAFSISAPPASFGGKSDEEGKEYEISDSSWIPEDVMLSGERTALIEQAIDQLPENYKRIIRLRHNDDLEYEEIANVLKLPMGTVKVHLHRARAALARMLEGKI
ncbi:MAG TPA: sigma-70 family RNA polymerase sigma factor [Candidatus Kapabacteria bacterium]